MGCLRVLAFSWALMDRLPSCSILWVRDALSILFTYRPIACRTTGGPVLALLLPYSYICRRALLLVDQKHTDAMFLRICASNLCANSVRQICALYSGQA